MKELVARLYPEPGKYRYVRFRLVPTIARMRARSKEIFGTGASGVLAFCVTRDGAGPCVAEIVIPEANLCLEIVTHELLHATIAWGRTRRIKFDYLRLDLDPNAVEEPLAWAIGSMMGQVERRLKRWGVI